MKKKLLFEIDSKRAGSVFISKGTGNRLAHVWPAAWGIQKQVGCIDFTSGNFGVSVDSSGQIYENEVEDICPNVNCSSMVMQLTEEASNLAYFDHCGEEEAWLVYPVKDGFRWERVDHKLKLLT